jgi:hypothetical protein
MRHFIFSAMLATAFGAATTGLAEASGPKGYKSSHPSSVFYNHHYNYHTYYNHGCGWWGWCSYNRWWWPRCYEPCYQEYVYQPCYRVCFYQPCYCYCQPREYVQVVYVRSCWWPCCSPCSGSYSSYPGYPGKEGNGTYGPGGGAPGQGNGKTLTPAPFSQQGSAAPNLQSTTTTGLSTAAVTGGTKR